MLDCIEDVDEEGRLMNMQVLLSEQLHQNSHFAANVSVSEGRIL